MSEVERADYERNKERWDKNFERHFPELYKVRKYNPVMHKYDEPHYERNMQDIRSSIFTSKWVNSIEKFTNEEVQKIHEFFLYDATSNFFERETSEDEYKPTPLYQKFMKELNFPDIC